MRSFSGKVVLVTGGSSGIGLALAEAFDEAGAKVIVWGRDPVRLAEASRRRPAIAAHGCDITSATAVSERLQALGAQQGGLDILVNNAGWMALHDFAAAPPAPAAIAAEIEANLTAHLAVTALALPLMRPGGAIVFVGSGYGWAPFARAAVYSAAKAGIRAFARALRRQVRARGIAVMEVVPPVVDTPATTRVAGRKVSPEAVARATLDGLRRSRREVFIGAARALPLMLRLAPRLIEAIVAGKP